MHSVKALLSLGFRLNLPGIGHIARWYTRDEILPSIPTLTKSGVQMSADPQHHTDQIILRTGNYEPHVSTELQRYCRPGAVLWDIGANSGFHSLTIKKKFPHVEVLSIEPSPMNFSYLYRNTMRNSLQIELLCTALSSQDSFLHLNVVDSGNTGLNSFLDRDQVDFTGQLLCRVTSGDSLVLDRQIRPPTLIKLDVEGYELQVLAGMRKILSMRSLDVVVIEGTEQGLSHLVRDELCNAGLSQIERLLDGINFSATRPN